MKVQDVKIAVVTIVAALILGTLAMGCTLSQVDALRTIQSVQGVK